jgi:hypothetical protein
MIKCPDIGTLFDNLIMFDVGDVRESFSEIVAQAELLRNVNRRL